MGPTSDDLRRDIEVKREELGAHVAELGEHVTPGRLARRRWEGVRSSVLGGPGAGTDAPAGVADGARPSARPVAVASFVAGLVLGMWLTRRRYLARLARLDT